MNLCPLCNRISGSNGSFLEPIIEFKQSILFHGAHARFPGYCILVSKNCIKEWHDLLDDEALEFGHELRTCSKAIAHAFQADKINLASLGNVVPHLHWHIIPRYKTDPSFQIAPFALESEFSRFPLTHEYVQLVKEKLTILKA